MHFLQLILAIISYQYYLCNSSNSIPYFLNLPLKYAVDQQKRNIFRKFNKYNWTSIDLTLFDGKKILQILSVDLGTMYIFFYR